jgi:hypothetical protein
MQHRRSHLVDNTTSIRPRPTKLSGAVMIVAGAVFLLFCVVPFSAAEGEAKPFAMIFGFVWILACSSFIIYGIYILSHDKPSSGIVFDIEDNAVHKDSCSHDDFDARIRKLQKLKEDRLITEEEYSKKRAEIINEPW